MPQQHDTGGSMPPPRYGCTYKPHCDNEATTTVVINGKARAVCEWCRRDEVRRQNFERERQAKPEVSI